MNQRIEIGIQAIEMYENTSLLRVQIANEIGVSVNLFYQCIAEAKAYKLLKKVERLRNYEKNLTEPIFMKQAQTTLLEPIWLPNIDFNSLPPTTDEKAIEYMINKF